MVLVLIKGMDYQQEFIKRYKNLNTEQKEAVDTIEGPVIVLAGPGCGKTELLGLRVANILKQTDTAPENILCLTFTDSAALNMRQRLVGLIGKDAYKVGIHTFHSFGAEIINQNPEYFFSGAQYQPADPLTQVEVLTSLFDNLDHENPFKIWHEEQKYTYLKDVQQTISALKREGLTPEEFDSILDDNNLFLEQFTQPFIDYINEDYKKLGLNGFENFLDRVIKAASLCPQYTISSVYPSLAVRVVESLQILHESLIIDFKKHSKQITSWRNEWGEKNSAKQWLPKDLILHAKHKALATLYKEYRDQLHNKGLFDFDDMILEVINVLENNKELKYRYNEQYLYVLIDEFQDTNIAQSRLLDCLVDAEISNGSPNILAVGDDDQAIYKFQGANMDNLIHFLRKYPNSKHITLHTNYRSHENILKLAQSVIDQSKERLGLRLGIEKKLTAFSIDGVAPYPREIKGRTHLEQITHIAENIQTKIENGQDPDEIAIIVRKHSQLEQIISLFTQLSIPIRYDFGRNVLNLPAIEQIITLLQFIDSVGQKETETADHLLPVILSYPFWGIKSQIVYDISIKAYTNRMKWLEVMKSYDDKYIQDIADFLIRMGIMSKSETGEKVLDYIMGVDAWSAPENEIDEETQVTIENNEIFVSPFKSYWKEQPDYLLFLSHLKVFIQALREYKPYETIATTDILIFVKLMRDNNLSLIDKSPYNQQEKAVNLITCHKAKGLEFEMVYIIDCLNEVWTRGGNRGKIKLPSNLRILPSADNDDDFLRLFFVAVTRAKRDLFVTYYEQDDKSKQVEKLKYLVGLEDLIQPQELSNTFSVQKQLELWVQSSCNIKYSITNEKEWLRPHLEKYTLSVTHLNNFLDVSKGGPQLFLEQNLLRFPQSKPISSRYGSAMHAAMSDFFLLYRKTGQLPGLNTLLEYYNTHLVVQRLSKKDFEDYLYRGNKALTTFYNLKHPEFRLKTYVEFDFARQGVTIEDALITGKIDQMIESSEDNQELVVIDLKTGKPSFQWKGKEDREKIKLENYRRQLVFYKLLVENSKQFAGQKYVKRGGLLFMEPDKDTQSIVDLMLEISKPEVDEVVELIRIVWKRINNLDFPDTSQYSQDYKGNMRFKDDLLAGKI